MTLPAITICTADHVFVTNFSSDFTTLIEHFVYASEYLEKTTSLNFKH